MKAPPQDPFLLQLLVDLDTLVLQNPTSTGLAGRLFHSQCWQVQREGWNLGLGPSISPASLPINPLPGKHIPYALSSRKES